MASISVFYENNVGDGMHNHNRTSAFKTNNENRPTKSVAFAIGDSEQPDGQIDNNEHVTRSETRDDKPWPTPNWVLLLSRYQKEVNKEALMSQLQGKISKIPRPNTQSLKRIALSDPEDIKVEGLDKFGFITHIMLTMSQIRVCGYYRTAYFTLGMDRRVLNTVDRPDIGCRLYPHHRHIQSSQY